MITKLATCLLFLYPVFSHAGLLVGKTNMRTEKMGGLLPYATSTGVLNLWSTAPSDVTHDLKPESAYLGSATL